MRRWGFFLSAVAISPLVLPLMTVAIGLFAAERVLEDRRVKQRALDGFKRFETAVGAYRDAYKAASAVRPSRYELLVGEPIC